MFAAYILLLCCLPCYIGGYSINNVRATSCVTAVITFIVSLTTIVHDLAINCGFTPPCLFTPAVSLPVLLAGALCASPELLQHLDVSSPLKVSV